MFVHEPDALRAVADACRAHDVLLIADEVATGFGRTGTLFACEQAAVRPDLMCIGKGITGGYLPLSATVASNRVYEAFLGPDLSELTLYHGHSYSGNALAAAVALRHLELLDERDVVANVRARGEELGKLLDASVTGLPGVAEIRRRGLMTGIDLAPPTDGLRWGRRVTAACVDRGVLIRPLGDVIVLMPPLDVTSDELQRIVDALHGAISEVCGAGG
jgi:adenosylmethionine-8-amino-7-oxononanoate aminotransferase